MTSEVYNNINIKVETSKLEPNLKEIEKLNKDYKKYFTPEAHIRTVTKFIFNVDNKGMNDKTNENKETLKDFLINKTKAQIIRNQYHLPMKYLKPFENNIYICQKSVLYGKSQNIKDADITIEPLNIGFDKYISYIPINQELPEGTIFKCYVKNDYSSNTRKFFDSSALLNGKDDFKDIPFDKNIHIGCLDIGSEYNARFVVDNVDQSLFDSYCKFGFRVSDNSISIITYDFMKVKVKDILREVKEIVEKQEGNKDVAPILEKMEKSLK